MTAEQEQEKQAQEAFARKASTDLLDMLAAPLPESLQRRAVLPKCPHCHRRPELTKNKHKSFPMQFRPYSSQTIMIDVYEVLPCCTAVYDQTKRVTEASKLQIRRSRETAKS